MKLAKSLLLGSATAFVAVAGANAADLPSKKAAPVNYVKVCDAYGAGFYTIPGTDTCIKVGGRARSDFAFSGKQDIFSTGTIDKATGATVNNIGTSKNSSNTYGWEARGRVDVDARTPTSLGTVQAVSSVRLSRVTGVLNEAGPQATAAPPNNNATATLEAAYIRFAGFTFGAARDNFQVMPSTFYGTGHFASFANGAKQIAYTAVLGGGLSATVAVQDAADTTLGGVNTTISTTGWNYFNGSQIINTVTQTTVPAPGYAYNAFPQINGRVDFDQSWGTATVIGAVSQADAQNSGATGVTNFNKSKTIWALGGGLKLNLPMIAAGDVLWLNGGYADGMTEYTTNWTSNKGSDTRRNVGGYALNHPSWINTLSPSGTPSIETLKSWNFAAIFTHFWTPQWRHSVLASYGQVDGTTTSKALTYGAAGAFGDAKVWNVGTQLAFVPVSNFEIGVDVLYARVEQDIRRAAATGTTGSICNTSTDASCVTREKQGNWTGRLRVERTF